ncbi:DUF222 domain-containing protein, partial [Microbacterium sp. NPDC087591]|uniref:DUF222 domain-containing protein n=1 Tax=Microbacterium sp. NPDC087591 TaxID=3364192 RepID=UPI00382D6F7C
MNSAEDLLERVVSDLEQVLGAGSFAALSDDAKMRVLQLVGDAQRKADAIVVETVASVAARPAGSGDPAFCGRFGCRTMHELLQRVLRLDATGASRVVQAARAVHREINISSGGMQPARWPALREALLDGTIGIAGLLAAIGPIEKGRHRIAHEARVRADAELARLVRGVPVGDDEPGVQNSIDAAPVATPEDLRVFARVIAAYLDPDGAESAEEAAMRGRGVILGRAKNGLIPIRGDLLPETAGQLQRIWDAYLNPKVDGPPVPGVRFVPSDNGDAQHAREAREALDEQDRADRAGDVLPSGDPGGMVDPRTRAQK